MEKLTNEQQAMDIVESVCKETLDSWDGSSEGAIRVLFIEVLRLKCWREIDKKFNQKIDQSVLASVLQEVCFKIVESYQSEVAHLSQEVSHMTTEIDELKSKGK